jgi:hypothetical protein
VAIHHRTDARATPKCDSRTLYPFRFELARSARYRDHVRARTYARSAPRGARTGRQIRRTDSLQSRLSKSTRLRLDCRGRKDHGEPRTFTALGPLRYPIAICSGIVRRKRIRDSSTSETSVARNLSAPLARRARIRVTNWPTCDPRRVNGKGQVNQEASSAGKGWLVDTHRARAGHPARAFTPPHHRAGSHQPGLARDVRTSAATEERTREQDDARRLLQSIRTFEHTHERRIALPRACRSTLGLRLEAHRRRAPVTRLHPKVQRTSEPLVDSAWRKTPGQLHLGPGTPVASSGPDPAGSGTG